MRATVIAGLIILGASGSYILVKQSQKPGSVLSASTKIFHSTASRKKTKFSKKKTLLDQGAQHESASHRSSQQVESDLEGVDSEEGASSSYQQAQSLPSIYQDEELEPTGSALDLADEISTEGNEKALESQKQPVVYGVPVASWLKHAKNQLPFRVRTDQPEGMRVFFNCMELKKEGTQQLSQSQCKEIAVSREKSKGAALIQ